MDVDLVRKTMSSGYVYLAYFFKFPSFIQMELATKCNLACEMCEYNKLYEGNLVEFEQFKPVFDSIIKANPLSRIFPKLMLWKKNSGLEDFRTRNIRNYDSDHKIITNLI